MKSIKYLLILTVISACNSDFSKCESDDSDSIQGDTIFVKDSLQSDTIVLIDTIKEEKKIAEPLKKI